MKDMSYVPILVNGVLTPSLELIERIASSLTHNEYQFIALSSKDEALLNNIARRSKSGLMYEQDAEFQSVIDGMRAQMAKDGFVDGNHNTSERLPNVAPRGEFLPMRLTTYQDYKEGDASEHEYINHAEITEALNRGEYVIALHDDPTFFEGIEYPESCEFNHYRIEKALCIKN